ncbi:MAG TPA: GvpL/GvpF family gas vesicle protein, partial [Mycobacterium sp.]|nr:GvpL/GvpF family gas vesicle protein [Mycobacterium sp.]
VDADDLAAVVGSVGLDEFGEDGLRRNLEDLDWLAAKARAHDATVSAVGRLGPVIPVRMATIYLDDWRVRQLLVNEHDDFDTALRRVSGREELGVKGYADPKGLQDDSPSPDAAERRSGTAYLLRRRRQLASQEEAYRLAAAEAEQVHTTLMRHAVDGKRKPPTDKTLSGRDDWIVLNGTYLVDEDVIDLFLETVGALDRSTARIRLEVTGPWPPYSFAGDLVAI